MGESLWHHGEGKINRGFPELAEAIERNLVGSVEPFHFCRTAGALFARGEGQTILLPPRKRFGPRGRKFLLEND